MAVVTIRGHLGSGAQEVGKLVAGKLNIDFVDREIIAEVAQKLKWSKEGIEDKEMPPGTLGGRILEALSRSYPGTGYPGAYVPTWELPLDDTSYLTALEAVIKDLAASSPLVIRGRGSQFILKDCPDCLHVLLVSPFESRLNHVMESLEMDEEQARKEIERYDSSHHEFAKRYFRSDLEDPLHYDIVINTHRLTIDGAASIIVDALPFRVGAGPARKGT